MRFHEGDKTFDQQVRDALAEVYRIRADLLLGHNRDPRATEARKLGYFILRTWGGVEYSWGRIGKIFAGRDHQTILSGSRRINMQLRVDSRLLKALDHVLLLLQVPTSACSGFAAMVVDGKAVDYTAPVDRHDGDLCAQPGCLAPRGMHGRRLRSLPIAEAA